MQASANLTDAEYARLAALRHSLRAYLHWSGEQAQAAGLTPAQHQLLLAVRAADSPTIGAMAEALLIRHHSAVELADRAQAAGLLERHRDPAAPGTVRLTLTELGADKLRSLSQAHQRELVQLGPTIRALLRAIEA